jgi:hypothetical protein
MTTLIGTAPEELSIRNPVFPAKRRFPILRDLDERAVLALTIGTPEHAELVAAVKRNFPEVYETN